MRVSTMTNLRCPWCQAVGTYRAADILVACTQCGKCRTCERDRRYPCEDCRRWDKENRTAEGKVNVNGVRTRGKHGQ